jgi:hypothetical protein
MLRMTRTAVPLSLLAAAASSSALLADYSTSPATPLVVQATGTDDVQPKIAAGPSNSHYISFFTGAGYDVSLMRLDKDGKAGWAAPVLVEDRGLSSTVDYGLASDAAGNAYVAYENTAGGIECTSVSPAGTIRWSAAISASGGANARVTVASDGFVWVAHVEGSGTRVQRLDPATGALGFTPPVALTETGASQFAADIEPSENGAVIVSCVRYATFNGPKILRAHRVEASGARPWAAIGVSVFTTGSLQFGNFPPFISDGAGGGYFAWYATSPLQCYVQRVNASGALMYGTNGVAVTTTTAGAERTDPWMLLGSDGRLYVSFTQHTPNSSIYGIFAQCFAKGVPVWGASAMPVEPLGATYSRGWARVLQVGNGVAVSYNDTPSAVQDNLRCAMLDAGGAVTGRFDIATSSGIKYRYEPARGVSGGSVLAWQGGATTGASDIFAARVNSDGTLGPPAGGVFGDLDGDGRVSSSDITIMLSQWGGPGSGDLVPNGVVDSADITALLGAWTG